MSALFCDRCFRTISRKNVNAALQWVRLANSAVNGGGYVCIIPNPRNSILETLERMEYIITHETDRIMVVKVEGMIYDEEDNEFYFCNDDEHYD